MQQTNVIKEADYNRNHRFNDDFASEHADSESNMCRQLHVRVFWRPFDIACIRKIFIGV